MEDGVFGPEAANWSMWDDCGVRNDISWREEECCDGGGVKKASLPKCDCIGWGDPLMRSGNPWLAL